jgi:hypothetical protein
MPHSHDRGTGGNLAEQICAVIACGALGAVALTLWIIPDSLTFLGLQFQAPLGNAWLSPILWGGLTAVALASIHAIRVSSEVGRFISDWALDLRARVRSKHDWVHELSHNQKCSHCQSWAPSRYVILMIPVCLYWFGLVPAAASYHVAIDIQFDGTGPSVSAKGGEIIQGFFELGRAAATEESRKYYEGRTAHVVGQVTNLGSQRFGLVRYKISCCAADAVALHLRVDVAYEASEDNPPDLAERLSGKWAEITGLIQFRKLHDSEEYVTVVKAQAKDIRAFSNPPKYPFVY